jgi:hypothetical protein
MSASVLFIIGSIVFAITVYGAVMAGGLLLTGSQLDQDDVLMRGSQHADRTAGVPLHVKY